MMMPFSKYKAWAGESLPDSYFQWLHDDVALRWWLRQNWRANSTPAIGATVGPG